MRLDPDYDPIHEPTLWKEYTLNATELEAAGQRIDQLTSDTKRAALLVQIQVFTDELEKIATESAELERLTETEEFADLPPIIQTYVERGMLWTLESIKRFDAAIKEVQVLMNQ